jgi:hypothetical protein
MDPFLIWVLSFIIGVGVLVLFVYGFSLIVYLIIEHIDVAIIIFLMTIATLITRYTYFGGM